MFAPLSLHWYASGAVPEAMTVNVAVCPTLNDCETGCVTMVGADEGSGAAFEVPFAAQPERLNVARARQSQANKFRMDIGKIRMARVYTASRWRELILLYKQPALSVTPLWPYGGPNSFPRECLGKESIRESNLDLELERKEVRRMGPRTIFN